MFCGHNIELSCAAESNPQDHTSRRLIELGEPQRTKSSRIKRKSRRQLQRFVMIAHGMSWAGPYHSNLAISQCPVDSPLTDDTTSTTSHSISDATNRRGITETRKGTAFQQSHQTVAGVGLFPQIVRLFEGRPSFTDIGNQTL